MTPIIIAVEGPDAVGKTTTVHRLAELLRAGRIPTRKHSHAAPPAGAGPWRTALWFAGERARIAEEIAADKATEVHIIDRWVTSARMRTNALWVMERRHGTLMVPHEGAYESLYDAELLALPHVGVLILDAPDEVLDARAAKRGAVRTELERVEALQYRIASGCGNVIDASGTLDETVAAVMVAVGL